MSEPADINELAERLAAAGYIVTIAREVESAGAAAVLGITPGTLRNWRTNLHGPRWTFRRGQTWYRIGDLIAWLDEPRDATVIVPTGAVEQDRRP